jgi:hypothetical protein
VRSQLNVSSAGADAVVPFGSLLLLGDLCGQDGWVASFRENAADQSAGLVATWSNRDEHHRVSTGCLNRGHHGWDHFIADAIHQRGAQCLVGNAVRGLPTSRSSACSSCLAIQSAVSTRILAAASSIRVAIHPVRDRSRPPPGPSARPPRNLAEQLARDSTNRNAASESRTS